MRPVNCELILTLRSLLSQVPLSVLVCIWRRLYDPASYQWKEVLELGDTIHRNCSPILMQEQLQEFCDTPSVLYPPQYAIVGSPVSCVALIVLVCYEFLSHRAQLQIRGFMAWCRQN